VYKRFDLTSQIVAMTAGSSAGGFAMLEYTIASGASGVKTIAEAWAMAFADYRRREAERSLLAPLGLNLETYRREPPESRASLDDELRRWELEEAAIITGLDATGAHLYTVSDPGWASCEDEVSFAAIGSGSGHAAAEFMRAKYNWTFSVARALLLVYRAKRSSEVDPFVGTDTDIFVIGPGDSASAPVADALFQHIVSIHNETMERQQIAIEEADKTIEKQVAAFLKEQAEKAIEQSGTAVSSQQTAQDGGKNTQSGKAT
jgi:hypothetical protein